MTTSASIPVTHPHESASDDDDALSLSIEQFRALCISGSQSEIEKFLSQNAFPLESLNSFGPGQASPLCEAARHGHVHIVKYLSKEKGLPLFEDSIETVAEAATTGAVKSGNMGVLDFLIEKGWDVNINPGRKWYSTLALALGNEFVVQWFLDHNADPNGPYPPSMTVTAFAAFSAPLSTLKLLTKAGGQVKETDAIVQAVLGHKNGFPDRVAVIQYLIDIGAPLDIYTPMYNGVKESEGQWASIVSLFGQETALQKAVRQRLPDMVKLLVKSGANVAIKGGYANSSVSKGETALEIAEILGYNDIQKLLVDN